MADLDPQRWGLPQRVCSRSMLRQPRSTSTITRSWTHRSTTEPSTSSRLTWPIWIRNGGDYPRGYVQDRC